MIEKYSYDAYGSVIIKDANNNVLSQSAIGNRYMFTGREFDSETGLYYYRARYYDPKIGRFLTRDPIGYAGGMNLYRYCGNNPVNYIDPLGLDYWIEGSSPGEPAGHQSICVGDPNGRYDSYSFGANGNITPKNGFEGEVYKDPIKSGKIDQNHYRKTKLQEDAAIKNGLENQVGNKGPYRPWNTCRNYSQGQFKNLSHQGYGSPASAPVRPDIGQPSSNVPMSSSSITSSEPLGPTSGYSGNGGK